MSYTQNVISQFALELKDTYSSSSDHWPTWRLYVLNPLLQCQLHRYPDHMVSILAKHFTGLKDEELKIAINTFYLSRDPLVQGATWTHCDLTLMQITEGALTMASPLWGYFVKLDTVRIDLEGT